ncbi:amino acid adenylation domain-containing protein [Paraglaciecola sp.]|uniref:amino acid adenylation domain-containing protein n=1 Tax=Paraglaciecola sp. TaxID=1920173 RepID=UPI0030F49AE3
MFIQNFIDSLEQHNPNAVAIEYGATKKNYKQLETEIVELTSVLSSKVTKGDIVAVYMPVCPELVVSMLTIMRMGGIFLPVDPANHRKENIQKLALSSPVVTLTQTTLVQEVEQLTDTVNDVIDTDNGNLTLISHTQKNQAVDSPKLLTWRKGLPDDIGYIYFTSGSTGRPKGVLGRLTSLAMFIKWESEMVGVNSSDRVSLLTPQTFDPFLRDVLLPLANGATLCIPTQQLSVADSQTVCDWLNTSQISISHIVPSVFELLLDTFLTYSSATTYAPHTLLFAGEPLTPALIKKLRKVESLNTTQLINLYGTTESTLAKCANRVFESDTTYRSFPVGKPMPGIELAFRKKDGAISSCFTEGEICFVGDAFSHGYFIDKSQPVEPTSELMIVDGKTRRVCPTGDLGQLDITGLLVVKGRKDNQIKINGKRVELAEIEHALEKVATISKAVVVVDPNSAETRLIAWVTLVSSDTGWQARTILDYLHGEIDSYKVPQQIFPIHEFPLSSHGKVDRKRLTMNVGEMHDIIESSQADNILPPRTKTEKWLTELYRSLLQCENISIADTFIRLGGRSLQALRALFRINQHFACRLTIGEFMRAGTLSGVASLIDQRCETNSQLPGSTLSADEKWLLSHQRRLLFFKSRFPQSVAYNMTYNVSWTGKLDEQKLSKALTALIANHPDLRARFYFDSQGRFRRDFIQQCQIDDLKHLDVSNTDDPSANAIKLAEKQAQTVLQLDSGEPYCFSLIKIGHQKYLLTITLHHIVADEWSVEQLFFEWIERYAQKGHPATVIDNTASAIHESILEAEFEQNIPKACKDYWLRQLAGLPPSTLLPFDFKQTNKIYKKAGLTPFSMTTRLTEQCKAVAKRLNVSLFSFLLSAFYLLLHKYSSQTDLAIGTPITGRTSEENFGFYVNLLCYRKQVVTEQIVADFIRDVQHLHEQNLTHSEMPFDYLVEQLCPERSDLLSPLFQHSFSFAESSRNMPNIEGCSVGQPEYVSNAECKFIFSLQLSLNDEKIGGYAEYDSAVYSADNINRFLETLDALVTQMTLHPHSPIGDLAILPSAQHQTILDWNSTSKDFSDNVNVPELIGSKLAQFQNLIAVKTEHQQLTYKELNSATKRLTNYLLSLGCTKGSRVAVGVSPSNDLIITMLAIMQAGAIYVPIDPSYPVARRDYMLQDSNAKLLITDQSSQQLFAASKVASINIEQLDLSEFSDETPANLCGPDDIAYIIYTSGSTGHPKGVEIFHKGVCNLAEAEVDLLRVNPSSRVLQFAAFSFDTSIWEIIVTLVAGGTLVVASRQAMMPGKNLATLCEQFDITHLTLPASALASMPDNSLGSVQVLIVAGEACSERLMQKWSEGRVFINSYGPTEATVSVSNAVLNAQDSKVHIGKPLVNTQCWILDKNQKITPIGAIGELYIGGVGLAKGYLNNPALTEARFIFPTDPLISANRLYRTGDVVRYLGNGSLEYLGRTDEQVKIRGFRVELAEIENCLCLHDQISDAVVLATQAGKNNEVALISYIVTDCKDNRFIKDVRQHLNDTLPSYAVPQFIKLLPFFPKLPNNKIDKSKLLELAQVADEEQKIHTSEQMAGAEKELSDTWKNLLSLQDIDPETSFFEAGGHSLLAVKVVSIMRKNGWELDVNAFFKSAKLSYLASQCVKIDATLEDANSTEDAPDINEPIALTHFQQGLWFENNKGLSNTYNVCKVFAFRNNFDQVALVQALNLVFRSNDIFSIQFGLVEGIPHQYRSATSHRTNLAYLGETLTEDKIIDFANKLAAKPVKLGQFSSIESALFRDHKEQFYLVINVHHIFIDDASMQELLHLIVVTHDAFKLRTNVSAPQGKSFLDYARKNGHPSEARILIQRDFWKHKLKNARTGLTVPYSKGTDKKDGNETQQGKTTSLQISPQITREIQQLSAKHTTTPMVTWLSLFFDFMQKHTKQNDICVGIPVSNRPQEYIDTAIGLYLNTLVFRHKSPIEETFETKLTQIKHDWLESYSFRDTPLSKLKEWLRYEAQTDFSLFDMMFVYKYAEKNDRVIQFTVNNNTAKFPLSFFVEDRVDGATLAVEFNTCLFEESDIFRMLNAFANYVQSQFDDSKISSHAPPKSETQSSPPASGNELSAIAQFERQVETTPQGKALQFGELHMTYFELNQLANQYAENLVNLRTNCVKRVGILLPRSDTMIALLLACLKLGVTYVPLDIGTPQKRLRYIVEDADLDIVVVSDDKLKDIKKYLLSADAHTLVVTAQSLTQVPKTCDSTQYGQVVPDLSTMAYIIYTSGSTGHPKGVMVDNAALRHYLVHASDSYVQGNSGSTAFHLSFAFDASITSIFVPLLNGGTLHVVPQGGEIEQLLSMLINKQPLDFIKLTPAHVDLLAQGLDKPVKSFVGVLVIGGEALLRNTLACIKSTLPNATLINEYGPTEAIVGCCVFDASDISADWSEAVPIGRPIKGIQLAILDEQGEPVQQGQVGELYICSEHLALGYLNKDELTASKFSKCHKRRLPFFGRSYASGDLVSQLDDGNLVYRGRIDDQIKHKGYRIELSEIEAVFRQHTSVAKCTVIYAKNEAKRGRLLSFVTATQQNPHLSEQHILDFCSDYLPEYMLPESVTMLDQMPLTSNGKIDREALDVLANKTSANTACYPSTKTQSLLHDIWQQLLGVDSFGINDSFFSIGGDSVFCLQVVFKLRKQGFNVNVETLLTHRTISQMASYLDQHSQHLEVTKDSLTPYEGPLPLTPIQHWLFSHDGGGHEWFNQAYLYRLNRQVDISVLETAVLNTLNRHVAMRQSFTKNAHGQYQTSIKSSLKVFNVSIIQTEAHSKESEMDWINAYVSQLDMAFDLTRAPLFKAWVFETQYSADFRILFVAHHTIVDAISWSVLVDEISQSYAHPNVDTLYGRYDNTLADYTKSRKVGVTDTSELKIWEHRKAQSFDPISSHNNLRSQSNVYRNCRHFSQRLDKTKTNLLEQIATCTMGVNVQEILLAALAKAVTNWSHINRVKIDVESHGRFDESQYDLATMVGWLTAIYPTIFSAPYQDQPRSWLEQAAQQLREVPRKGVGYGELQASYTDGWAPDAEICFNYLGKSFTRALASDAIIQTMDNRIIVQRHAPQLNRWYLIEFDAWIEQGCCQISWTFSKAIHEENSIVQLAELFEASLNELLETTKSSNKSVLVPADLPQSVAMSLADIANIQRHYPKVQQILPATPAQQGMAFHTRYNSGGPVYHEQIVYSISVPLDLDTFYNAWDQLISKHAMLRAALSTDRFQSPIIIVHQSIHPIIAYIDLSAITKNEQDDYVKSIMDMDLDCPFELDKSPLIRVHLILTGEASNQLFISHHHGILDGWSMTLIIDELNTLLIQNTDNKPLIQSAKPDISVLQNFCEFVHQNNHPDTVFWAGVLQQDMTRESLPFVTLTDGHDASRSAIHQRMRISARDCAMVYDCASDLNITLSTLVQGAWALVLHHFSRSNESMFGVTLSGRTIDVKHIESLVGLCINILPMRVNIEPKRSCDEWLSDIQKTLFSIQNHSQTSLPELTKMFQSSSRKTLFDSIVVLTNYQSGVDAKKQSIIDYKYSRETTNFPLTLVIAESEDELDCRLSGLPERIDSLWLTPILRMFTNSLISLAKNRTSCLSVAIQKSHDQMHGDSSCIIGDDKPLSDLTPSSQLTHFAKHNPLQIAVTDQYGEWTYSQLDNSVNELAMRIIEQLNYRDKRCSEQSVIAVCCKRNRALLAGLMSCLRLKAVFLPLDPDLPLQRLTYMAENANVALILSDDASLFKGTELGGKVLHIESNPDSMMSVTKKSVVPAFGVLEDELAYIMYTSGSTGKPKGVKIGIESLLNYLEFASATYSSGQAISSCVHGSIGFDGTITSLFIPIMTGGAVKMISENNTLGELAAEILTSSENLLLKITPSQLTPLAEQLNRSPVPHLKAIIIGGEALDYQHLTAFKHCAPNAIFVNEYGPTEATVGCCINIFDPFKLPHGAVPIGNPIHNTELLVCSDDMRILPFGAVGELCISGMGVAKGYINLHASTDEKFVDCTAHDNRKRRVYRTGDMIYSEPSGRLHYLGRQDDQVKLNGVRIELGEIEELVRQHAQVDSVAVVVSNSHNQLVAFVAGSENLTADRLRQKLQLALPSYMLPKQIIFSDSLPLTANGKVDRSLLMQQDVSRKNQQPEFVEPETETQHQICAMFCELLKQQRIGIRDDFFALGGHSLTAMQLLARVSQYFGVSISLKTLFSSSAVWSLSELIEQQIQNRLKQSAEANHKTPSSITPIPRIQRSLRHI